VVLTTSLSPADVRRCLLDLIDPAFMPRPIYIVDRIPRTETGKLSQIDLRDLVVAARQAARHVN
jgi:acyl-coenzyme A synthetase/AMP-(fatty) acid ligase